MRKIRRRKNSVRSIIILSMLCFVTMGIGYSYLQETLNVHVQVTKKDQRIDITEDVVTSGSGLYQDSYEYGRYVYRGSKPNNYIQFNDELWRIIAKETDGTYKVVSDKWLSNYSFDDSNHRKTENNTYCISSQRGCNVYGHIDGTYEFAGNSGTVTEDSSLAIYLNDGYYNGLTDTAKEQIQTHAFNIGGIMSKDDDTLEENIAAERAYTWTGNVGILNTTDTLRSSLDPNCTSVSKDYKTKENCINNYLRENPYYDFYWTMNGAANGSYNTDYNLVWLLQYDYSNKEMSVTDRFANNLYPVRPVVYLKADIQFIDGNGTQSDPYIITL